MKPYLNDIIKTFIKSVTWKTQMTDKKMKKTNLTFISVLYINNESLYTDIEKIYTAYISKHNSNRKKQIIFLMIPNEEGWHYITVINLNALLRAVTSKHNDKFCCLNCLYSFRTKKA